MAPWKRPLWAEGPEKRENRPPRTPETAPTAPPAAEATDEIPEVILLTPVVMLFIPEEPAEEGSKADCVMDEAPLGSVAPAGARGVESETGSEEVSEDSAECLEETVGSEGVPPSLPD